MQHRRAVSGLEVYTATSGQAEAAVRRLGIEEPAVARRFQWRAHHYARLEAFLVDVGQHRLRRIHRRCDHRLRIWLLLPSTPGIQVVRKVALNGIRARRRVRIGLFSLQIFLIIRSDTR